MPVIYMPRHTTPKEGKWEVIVSPEKQLADGNISCVIEIKDIRGSTNTRDVGIIFGIVSIGVLAFWLIVRRG